MANGSRSIGMSSDIGPAVLCNSGDSLNLLGAELHAGDFFGKASYAATSHDLDEVGSSSNRFSSAFDTFGNTITNSAQIFRSPATFTVIMGTAGISAAAGLCQQSTCYEKSRSDNDTFF